MLHQVKPAFPPFLKEQLLQPADWSKRQEEKEPITLLMLQVFSTLDCRQGQQGNVAPARIEQVVALLDREYRRGGLVKLNNESYLGLRQGWSLLTIWKVQSNAKQCHLSATALVLAYHFF
jgi:hypothetical protein